MFGLVRALVLRPPRGVSRGWVCLAVLAGLAASGVSPKDAFAQSHQPPVTNLSNDTPPIEEMNAPTAQYALERTIAINLRALERYDREGLCRLFRLYTRPEQRRASGQLLRALADQVAAQDVNAGHEALNDLISYTHRVNQLIQETDCPPERERRVGLTDTEPLPQPPIARLPPDTQPVEEMSASGARLLLDRIIDNNIRALERYRREDLCRLFLLYTSADRIMRTEDLLHALADRIAALNRRAGLEAGDAVEEYARRVAEMMQEADCAGQQEVSEETSRVAVQTPEECVGTTYHLDWTGYWDPMSDKEKEAIADALLRTEYADFPAHQGNNGNWEKILKDSLRDRDPEAGWEQAVEEFLRNEEQGDVPLEDEKTIPEPAPKSAEPSDTPKPEVPVASTPQDEPRDAPQVDVPDLGLVKAVSEVVAIAVTDKKTGEPVTDVAIKMLPEEPPLPGVGVAEASSLSEDFDDASFFEDDLEGGYTGEDGKIELTDLTIPVADTPSRSDEQEAEVVSKPEAARPDEPAARRLSLRIDAEPRERHVVGLAEPAPAKEVLSVAKSDAMLAPFVVNALSIGSHSIAILSVPKSDVARLKEGLETSETVSWFEPDPCWSKQKVLDCTDCGLKSGLTASSKRGEL